MPDPDPELLASTPVPLDAQQFNRDAVLPHGLSTGHIQSAMEDFLAFIGLINTQLRTKQLIRLESMLMPANFSSIVGEFMGSTIPKYCPTLVKNRYHNGHPDLIPMGLFDGDAVQHATEGVEIKGSRYLRGWQGHNAEDTWLMVFVFDSNRPVDLEKNSARPFRFVQVLGAALTEDDWAFAGRSPTSRRTITATVTPSGYAKMAANWIYGRPGQINAAPEVAGPEPVDESDLAAEQ